MLYFIALACNKYMPAVNVCTFFLPLNLTENCDFLTADFGDCVSQKFQLSFSGISKA